MSSIMLTILNGIKANLESIIADDTVDVQGSVYTYQTGIGHNVKTGLDLRDLDIDQFPAATINNIFAAPGDNGSALPDMGVIATFAIEAGDRLSPGDDWLTVGDSLLQDLQVGIDINPASDSAYVIIPGAGGRLYEWLQPKSGSQICMVRRWYSVEYQERYRGTGTYFR